MVPAKSLRSNICQSLDVIIPYWDPFRGIISHRGDAEVLIRFNVIHYISLYVCVCTPTRVRVLVRVCVRA